MEPKEFARLFGGFSTEKRVQIVKALIDAGPEGLSLLELSRNTELSVIDIGITAEALLLGGDIDAGWDGQLTLELSNVATLPITLYPGMKIGQLCLFRLSSPAEHPYGSEKYGSRYQGQRGPTPSRSFANFHRTEI